VRRLPLPLLLLLLLPTAPSKQGSVAARLRLAAGIGGSAKNCKSVAEAAAAAAATVDSAAAADAVAAEGGEAICGEEVCGEPLVVELPALPTSPTSAREVAANISSSLKPARDARDCIGVFSHEPSDSARGRLLSFPHPPLLTASTTE
jgi:hypothetical protein